MPTIECGEPLVAIDGLHPRVAVDKSPENMACLGYTPTFKVRETVARRLVDAAENLASSYRLLIKESLRPASVQKFSFERRLRRISTENPNLTDEEAVALTSQFIAPPWVAGHPGGGAIDVTLCNPEGGELDLGCAYDEDEAASKGACFSRFDGLGSPAREHRKALFDALDGAGFVNYPFEWWHWSYGDRYWAVVKQAPHALYGPVEASDATSV
jgi:D-alanyl-D-alanine dipeptidase